MKRLKAYVSVYPDGIRINDGDTDLLVSLNYLEKLRLGIDLTMSCWGQVYDQAQKTNKKANSATPGIAKGEV